MKNFILIIVMTFFTVFAQAQKSDLKIFVTLSPAGDFIAKTSAVKGVAIEKADGSFVAENVEVDLNSLQTGISLRDDHMKEKYLDTKTYPKATLKKAIGKGGKGVGLLNIKGKDINIKGDYKKDGKYIIAEFVITLAEVGITDVNYKGVGVEEEIKIEIAMPVVAEGSRPAAKPAAAKPLAKPKPKAGGK